MCVWVYVHVCNVIIKMVVTDQGGVYINIVWFHKIHIPKSRRLGN